MKIMPDVEQEIRRKIRDERAKDPLITVIGLQSKPETHFNHTFHRDYVAKLTHKVSRQTLVELDRTRLEERMNFTRENYRMMREALLKVVYWKDEDGPPRPRMADKVEAAKSVAMLDLALLKAEIETGMFKKPIELLAKEVYYEEIRLAIIAAWHRGSNLPVTTIQEMAPRALPGH
jgi:hypothetical protein